ncbi:MAG: hypothetical protein BJ554DRAFT_3730 [Olpidium bornovanus]|uniref:Uncharacterized protein n=1 Tax=Olpidium bornovanus TaxID=278681 RepID=A0A8H7ZNV3_9FUNG|nr:MAG: hypothetical protein BJ554DRAFT_3730 [Olpidium bornovanus]
MRGAKKLPQLPIVRKEETQNIPKHRREGPNDHPCIWNMNGKRHELLDKPRRDKRKGKEKYSIGRKVICSSGPNSIFQQNVNFSSDRDSNTFEEAAVRTSHRRQRLLRKHAPFPRRPQCLRRIVTPIPQLTELLFENPALVASYSP